jgi:hypothetical protein
MIQSSLFRQVVRRCERNAFGRHRNAVASPCSGARQSHR